MIVINYAEGMRTPSSLRDNSSSMKVLNDACRYFRLGNISRTSKLAGIHENYAVTTTEGDFVFKIIMHRSPEDLEKEIIYLKRLEKYHFPIPYYLSSPEGSFAFQRPGFIVVVMRKSAGVVQKPSYEINRQIGIRLARLHCVPISELPQKNHWLNNDYLPHMLEYAESAFGRSKIAKFIYLHKSLGHFVPREFPQSIVHSDLHPGNCLFIGNKLSTILDWEDVGIGACILDFAWTVLSFCCIKQLGGKRLLDNNLYRCLFDSYSQIRFFSIEERMFIKDAVKYMDLSFCLWMWLQLSVHSQEMTLEEQGYFEPLELNTIELD